MGDERRLGPEDHDYWNVPPEEPAPGNQITKPIADVFRDIRTDGEREADRFSSDRWVGFLNNITFLTYIIFTLILVPFAIWIPIYVFGKTSIPPFWTPKSWWYWNEGFETKCSGKCQKSLLDLSETTCTDGDPCPWESNIVV